VYASILVTLALVLGTAPSTRAQSPRPAGFGPTIEASAGYTYLNLSVPSVGRANLNGFDTTLTTNLTEHFGICGDFSYARASQTLSYNKASSVKTLTGGPVIYLVRRNNYTLYAHALFGGARVETTVPLPTGPLSGYVVRFAFAAGGGVQYRFSPRISFRLGADYLQTQFAQSETSFQGQSNFRAVVSFVYHFSSQRK
jgi:opacity protein-like surface antigen